MVKQGLLQRMQFGILRKTRDRFDGPTAAVLHQRNAGEARLPVDQNSTCAASSLETAGLCGEIADLVSQEFEKRHSTIDEFGPLFAVQSQLHGYFGHHAARGQGIQVESNRRR